MAANADGYLDIVIDADVDDGPTSCQEMLDMAWKIHLYPYTDNRPREYGPLPRPLGLDGLIMTCWKEEENDIPIVEERKPVRNPWQRE